MITNDNKWKQMATTSTANENEWQRVLKRMATSGTSSDTEWQRVKTNYNKWYYERQWVTTNDPTWIESWSAVCFPRCKIL